MANRGGISGSANAPQKNVLLKVILLGDGGVGKSCLMNRFVSNRFDTHSFHTIGVEFLNKEVEINSQLYTLQIWDTAGQERFKSLRTPFYRGSDICLLTFALDDKQSFTNLCNWRDEFVGYADVADKMNFPFVVIGNKVDTEAEKREIAYEVVMDWCSANGNIPYIETSAKESTNVQNAFNLAVERWTKIESKLDKVYGGQTVSLAGRTEGNSAPESRSCCFGSSP
jgi:small GTP-binding protein